MPTSAKRIASNSCSLWLQSDDHFYMRRQHGQGDNFPIDDNRTESPHPAEARDRALTMPAHCSRVRIWVRKSGVNGGPCAVG